MSNESLFGLCGRYFEESNAKESLELIESYKDFPTFFNRSYPIITAPIAFTVYSSWNLLKCLINLVDAAIHFFVFWDKKEASKSANISWNFFCDASKSAVFALISPIVETISMFLSLFATGWQACATSEPSNYIA
ncbi:MAG: hypothetical protein ACHP6H_01370 [Legionellales bacterium]